ncbi:hypothetical protein L6270_03925 [Candidatus Parcubacteria bacterium]|nr:hypothetical protein [Patescibacteria group bacterium]MBU4309112.1 hypothetical protein [Patescibacteria group bacterium]MBU4432708.1 hypothetical protein [Patescibacteria group bacterium]MBU4577473.1 hypothetical protein [Patescibacteria group bacterium]MCG2697161.1 hypothetical protein [Candidatus Parcubacteria bacterium]
MSKKNLTLSDLNEAARMFEIEGTGAFDYVEKCYGREVAELLSIVLMRKAFATPGEFPPKQEVSDKSIEAVCQILAKVKRGQATRIILPNGKYLFEKPSSPIVAYALKNGLECKDVMYEGDCDYGNINKLVHGEEKVTILIEGIDAFAFKDLIADEKECLAFFEKAKEKRTE